MNNFLEEKEKLLNGIENNTAGHWKEYYKNVPLDCIFEDLVIDINEIKRLTKENQKLKEEIEKIIAVADTNSELADKFYNEIQKLKEMQCIFLGTGCQNKIKEYKNQQKEFIEYLEDYIEVLKSQQENVNGLDILEEETLFILEETLEKYKEIIGEKDE